ncbi:DSBA-like thioredoxin domain protein (plasmid) [Paraburkholderia fungorum]|nr:DSBA-like thioredoxin domain protein [Paraburkholderia fungorum]
MIHLTSATRLARCISVTCASVTCATAGISLSAIAAPPPAPTQADMEDMLRKSLGPDIDVVSVARTPLAGIFAVNVGRQIIYTDRSANYVLVGQLIESHTRRNLTQVALQDSSRIDFASLPLANAIRTVKGDGSRRMAVFADPYCPYCKRLEQTLQKLDNVTIYTFLFPILTPDSKPMSDAIWCSPDRANAWSSWMLNGTKPSRGASCNAAAVSSNLALARSLGISGTPTIIFSNGTERTGALPTDELNSALDAGKS